MRGVELIAQPEPRLLEQVLDHVPFAIVHVDGSGRIRRANAAWRKLAREIEASLAMPIAAGADYAAAWLGFEPAGPALFAGMNEVLSGARARFVLTFACHSVTRLRWLELHAERIEGGAVVTHVDATETTLSARRSRVQAAVWAALAAHQPLLPACGSIMRAIAADLEWDFAALYTPEPDGSRLRCRELWTRPGQKLDALELLTRATDVVAGRGVPGRALSNRRPTWVEDITRDDSEPRKATAAGCRLQSALGVPICGDGEVLAVIEFFSGRRRRPDPEVLELLATVGAQLGADRLRARAGARVEAAEAAMSRARARLQTVLDCVPAFIVAVDRHGAIQFINRVLAGYERERVVGTPWLRYMVPGEQERMQSRLQTVLASGSGLSYKVTATDGEGRPHIFASHMAPMREGEHVTGVVIVSQDVTEQHRIEAELATAQRMAAVGTLAAGVAHEINTPVQFVSDSLEFLRQSTTDLLGLVESLRTLPPRVLGAADAGELASLAQTASAALEASDLEYVRQNAGPAFEACLDGLGRVANIVRSLKEFAHPKQPEMAFADLNRAVRSTLTVATNEYRYVADVQLELGDLPEVPCHIDEINQAVLNIVVNAAHAIADVVRGTDRRGKITVRTRVEAEHAVIEIADTGGGIPEAIRARVFDLFFTTKEVGKGTGQGLAIAHAAVVNKHGGQLTFETHEGRGTRFFIRIPLLPARAAGQG